MQQAAEQAPVIKTRKKILSYDDYVALTPPDSGNSSGIFSRNDTIESKVLTGFKISVREILEV